MAFRALLLPLLLAAAGSSAAAPPDDDLAAAMALPRGGSLVGATDAARFAWVENASGVRNVWVARAGAAPHRLTGYTDDDGQQIYDLALDRTGTTLAFVRGGDPEFPDDAVPNTGSAVDPPHQQLFVTATDGSAPRAIAEGHAPVFAPDGASLVFTHRGEIWRWSANGGATRIATVKGTPGNVAWSPDGSRIVFVDNRGDHSFVGVLDIGARKLTYLQPTLGYSDEPAWSPDGRHIAFVRFVDPPATAAADGGPYWSLQIGDSADGSVRALWTAPAGEGAHWQGTRGRNLFWSADGHILFPWERTGWLHINAIDATGRQPPVDLTPGAFEVESFLLDRAGRALLYAANAGDLDRRHLWRRPLGGGGAGVAVTTGSGIESYPVTGGDTLAVLATDATHPAYPATIAGGTLRPLGAAPAAVGFVAPEPVTYRAADGVEVHAQLFRGSGAGRHPALIFVHGGPRRQMVLGFHPSYYYSNSYIMNQHLARQGYDVLSVNYRSGTGYGQAFRDAPGVAREGAAEYRDVLAGGRWLAAQRDVDPQRIGIWGGSWGGYLTALALARDSALFRAGVDFHGVHAMVRPVEKTLSPTEEAAAHQRQWESSPMESIGTWRSPVLLIHGDDDKNVDFYQSLLLARELTARHVPYRELAFPNERHDFFRHADWLASYRAADAFFRDTLMQGSKP